MNTLNLHHNSDDPFSVGCGLTDCGIARALACIRWSYLRLIDGDLLGHYGASRRSRRGN
jgi:hypothetical protein